MPTYHTPLLGAAQTVAHATAAKSASLSLADLQASAAPAAIQPIDLYRYFDKITVWLRRPLDKAKCDELLRGGHIVTNKRCWFDHRYQQKIELYHPSPEALRSFAGWLHADDDLLLNYTEPACDLILPNCWRASDLDILFKRAFLQPWHGKLVPENYEEGFSTRKIEDGENRAGRWFQSYSDKPCRLTGEVNCFHFEGKHQGVQFIRPLGIRHPRDLLNFDFDAYFSRWMRLYELDCERLGRYDHNKRSGAKRRKASIRRSGLRHEYNCDQGRGEALYYVLSLHPTGLGHSLQRFVDRYGRGPFLRPVLFYVHVNDYVTSRQTVGARALPKVS